MFGQYLQSIYHLMQNCLLYMAVDFQDATTSLRKVIRIRRVLYLKSINFSVLAKSDVDVWSTHVCAACMKTIWGNVQVWVVVFAHAHDLYKYFKRCNCCSVLQINNIYWIIIIIMSGSEDERDHDVGVAGYMFELRERRRVDAEEENAEVSFLLLQIIYF